MTDTLDWRARRWATTHQRIYDTAIALFQELGFDAVNVGQIARGAEVSVPTFYAHYPSKEHLVMQLPPRRRSAPSSPRCRPTSRCGNA
ncbi:TetR/AcrR family transcriptional regulator [Blastococcus brunescens]|uniref:TetR/AcrR family transcriptional regulator n=1 Tax=Blastococcus brunescens TaxID=1564165 RepID=A0ABZ1B3D3_9ACTN|nr:TetR/AcrR family transcriptional regulator [Blastococcus sp. BMG 8361]WRL63859.1 TetR/AcrR family transcriptional regulator [Blastococcus sp. BMG 8361]